MKPLSDQRGVVRLDGGPPITPTALDPRGIGTVTVHPDQSESVRLRATARAVIKAWDDWQREPEQWQPGPELRTAMDELRAAFDEDRP
jgi:hypothetical protein